MISVKNKGKKKVKEKWLLIQSRNNCWVQENRQCRCAMPSTCPGKSHTYELLWHHPAWQGLCCTVTCLQETPPAAKMKLPPSSTTQRKLRRAVPLRKTILAARNLHGHARDGATSWSRIRRHVSVFVCRAALETPDFASHACQVLWLPPLPVTAVSVMLKTQRGAPSYWMEGGVGAFLPLQTFSPTMVAMLSGMWFRKPTCELWANSIPCVYVHSAGLRVPVNTTSVFLTVICHSHTRPHTARLARGKWTLILTTVSSKMTFWSREK